MEIGPALKVEYLLRDNEETKKYIVLSLLSCMETSEEAVEKLTSHLRLLSVGCDLSLANVDLNVIRDSSLSMDHTFAHYSTLFENEEKQKLMIYNINGFAVYKNEKKNDKVFREKAFKMIETLNFAEKLQDFEGRIMRMVEQYYLIQTVKPAAAEILKEVKGKMSERQMESENYNRYLENVLKELEDTVVKVFKGDPAKIQQFGTSIGYAIHHVCLNTKETAPVPRNEFGEDVAEMPLGADDIELPGDIRDFLWKAEEIYNELISEGNKKKSSKTYYVTIRCLLMHIICQARQYWDAANAVDVLVDMKNNLRSIKEELSATSEEYYHIAQTVRNTEATIQYLKNVDRNFIKKEKLSGFHSVEEFLFFQNFDDYFYA